MYPAETHDLPAAQNTVYRQALYRACQDSPTSFSVRNYSSISLLNCILFCLRPEENIFYKGYFLFVIGQKSPPASRVQDEAPQISVEDFSRKPERNLLYALIITIFSFDRRQYYSMMVTKAMKRTVQYIFDVTISMTNRITDA